MSSKKIGSLIQEVHDKRMFIVGQILEGSRRGELPEIPNLRLKAESLRRFEDQLRKKQTVGKKTLTIEAANKMLQSIYGEMHVNPWRRSWQA